MSAPISRRGPLVDGPDEPERDKFRKSLEQIVIDFPDDIEAKALYAEASMFSGNRVGADLLLKQVLAASPDHPGAHHYRVHLWDGPQGALALESCRRYSELVPRIGHALHMPGHVYAGLGMWHEAAISLDSATRAEIRYMAEMLVFPYNTWNYAHNRNYLSYVQEHLGLPADAIRGARELLAVPLDPKLNDAERFSPHWQGVAALTRALVKFERWDEILTDGSIPWGTSMRDKAQRAWVETLAQFGKGDQDAARKRAGEHAALKAEFDKPELQWLKSQYTTHAAELEARVALSKGDAFKGLGRMAEAAELELKLRDEYDDPPGYPYVLYTELGKAYLAQQSPALAIRAFDKTLSVVPNDPFTLAALARAQFVAGAKDKAAETWARLQYHLVRRWRRVGAADRGQGARPHGTAGRSLAWPPTQLRPHESGPARPRHLDRQPRAPFRCARCRRQAGLVRRVQGQERPSGLLPRRLVRALHDPAQADRRPEGRIRTARHGAARGEQRHPRGQREITGRLRVAAPLRSVAGQCEALQVVRRLRGDADSLDPAHRSPGPHPLGPPRRRAV